MQFIGVGVWVHYPPLVKERRLPPVMPGPNAKATQGRGAFWAIIPNEGNGVPLATRCRLFVTGDCGVRSGLSLEMSFSSGPPRTNHIGVGSHLALNSGDLVADR